jgi:hypothetical protein
VLNEIMAKLNQNDKLIGGGAIVVAVGWILGLVLGNRTEGVAGLYQVSLNYFNWGTAGLCAGLALTAAVAAVVILYLKFAPNVKIAWPMPIAQILLGVSVATVALAALTVLFQLTNGLSGAPVLMFVADIVFVGGGAAMAYGAYTEYAASSKTPAA